MSKFICEHCNLEKGTLQRQYRVSCNDINGVGFIKVFNTLEEASIEIQQNIGKYDMVTFKKEVRYVE